MTLISDYLIQAVRLAPSADNSQPWRVEFSGNTLKVFYATERVRDKTFSPENPATLLSMGAALENIQQAAEMIGVKIKINIPRTLDSMIPCYFEIVIENGDQNLNIANIEAHPLHQRYTNRFPFLTKPLPIALRQVLKNLTLNDARTVVFDTQPEIKDISELVRKASEIRFRTRETNEWLSKSLKFSGNKLEGLDVKTLDLPPGGAYFLRLIGNWQVMKVLNLLGTYKSMSFIDSYPLRKAPAIIAIISPLDFQNVMDAGRLMEQIWVKLNENGLAVHPYYVVSDQLNRRITGNVPADLEKPSKSVFESAKNLIQLKENESLQMLFRVGYPKKKVVRSKRLQINEICSP